MEDPFLADALDGYDKSKGAHTDRIAEMQEKISRQVHRKNNAFRYWSIAASVLVVISIGGYFLWEKNLTVENTVADKKAVDVQQIPEETIASEFEKTDSVKLNSEALIAQNEQKAIQFTPPIIVKDEGVSEIAVKEHPVEQVDIADMQLQKVIVIVAEEEQPKEDVNNGSTKVRGKVVDENGEPVVGASVTLAGTTRGTVTNPDGSFEMPVNEKNNISVSYLGYESLTLPADTSKDMLIALNESNLALNEVTVVAFGKQKKESLVGAVSTVEPTAIIMPQPVHGKKAFNAYLKKSMVRPTDEVWRGVKGKVELSFYIDKDGRPTGITVRKSLFPAADTEAIRLLNDGPDWTQGNGMVTWEIKF
jgi:cytoskeletal protein RodZ